MTKNTSILDLLPQQKTPELSPRMRRLLRLGNDGTYASDFDYEWSIALAAVNAGRSEAWLRKVLKDRGPFYASIEERGKEKAERYVSKLYAKAVAYREQNPPWRSPQDASVALAQHAAWVQTLPNWRGRKGNRNLEVLLAAINVGIEVGSNVVSFSTRQLAEKMKRSRKTVGLALKELAAERWLVSVQEKRSITDAPSYRIPVASTLLGRSDSTNIILPSRGVGSSGVESPPMLFDFLGFSAYRAWSLLNEDEGTDLRTLVTTTKLSDRTLREALLRLESFGLALKKDGAWYRVEADLDALAVEYGIPERRATKKQKHAEQRAKRMHDLGLGDRLEFHRKHDLVGEARNTIVDEHAPALVNAQRPRGKDAKALHLPSHEVRPQPDALSRAGATEREDGRAGLSRAGSQPVPNHDADGVSRTGLEGLGLPTATPRASVGRGQVDGGQSEMRLGVCTMCGHQGLSIPRSDGLAVCPKDQRAMVFDAEAWERFSTKPVPDALKILVAA
jgi:hypothetical protein